MKRKFYLSVCFGLICAIMLSMSRFEVACDDLRQNVLRLHIIANSDSDGDQALKLKIRDAILEKADGLFLKNGNLADAEKIIYNNLSVFEEIANEVVKENGFDYKATAKLGYSDFNTRYYDDFALPAGEYKSLTITLGEGKGKNWWCVVYPTVCISSAAKGKLGDSVKQESVKVAKNQNRYVMRFKVVEIYEKIKKLINL